MRLRMIALTSDLFRAYCGGSTEGVFQDFHPLTFDNPCVAPMVTLLGRVADTPGTDDQEPTVLDRQTASSLPLTRSSVLLDLL